jgi:hypothetical protein
MMRAGTTKPMILQDAKTRRQEREIQEKVDKSTNNEWFGIFQRELFTSSERPEPAK